MRNAVSSIAVLLFGIILEAPVYALLYDFEDKAQMDEWTWHPQKWWRCC